MAPPPLQLSRLMAFALAVVLAGCDSAVTSPVPGSPSAPGGTGTPGSTAGPASSGGPVETGGPGGTFAPSAGDPSLPLPTLDEPGAIGMALYDPTQMGDAVVSLVNAIGIGIYAADGTVVRAGNERAAGDPWLLDREVQGLIDMGTIDLLEGEESGGKYRLTDLYEWVSPVLPGLDLAEFIAAYRDSYAEHPDEFAPAALLGQPLDETTPLTRVQLWLLFVDGFVEPAATAAVRPEPGALFAAGSARLGTARRQLPVPRQPQPSSMTADDWRELWFHMPTIGQAIGFRMDAPSAHEGHGRNGDVVTVRTIIDSGQPFVSPVSGRTLLRSNIGNLAALDVRWRTRKLSTLTSHGTLNASLPSTTQTNAAGETSVTYTPKKEDANGRGFQATEIGSLFVEADVEMLIRVAYSVDIEIDALLTGRGSWGTRRAGNGIPIEWHTDGIEVTIQNDYRALVDASVGPLIASAYRKGFDVVTGVLTARSDGTYRGTFLAQSTTLASNYEYSGVLAGSRCGDAARITSNQWVDVVARKIDRASGGGPDVWSVTRGTEGDLYQLSFYPASAPIGPTGCQMTIPYLGPGPDGNQISGTYMPFNDSRWSSPSIGYEVYFPQDDELSYKDESQASAQTGVAGVDSIWTVVMNRKPPAP